MANDVSWTDAFCPLCNGAGVVMYKKPVKWLDSRVYEYAARCTCSRGNRYVNVMKSIAEVCDGERIKELMRPTKEFEDIRDIQLRVQRELGITIPS